MFGWYWIMNCEECGGKVVANFEVIFLEGVEENQEKL
jgi:hypothetical protein